MRWPMQKATSMTRRMVSVPTWEPAKSLAIRESSQSIDASARTQNSEFRTQNLELSIRTLQMTEFGLHAREPVGTHHVFCEAGAEEVEGSDQLAHPERETVVEF